MLKLIQARERGIPHGMPLISMTLFLKTLNKRKDFFVLCLLLSQLILQFTFQICMVS